MPPDTTSVLDITTHCSNINLTWVTDTDTWGSEHIPTRTQVATQPSRNTQDVRIMCKDAFRTTMLLETGDPIEAIERSLVKAVSIHRVPINASTLDRKLRQHVARKTWAQRKYRKSKLDSDKRNFIRTCTAAQETSLVVLLQIYQHKNRHGKLERAIKALTDVKNPKKLFRRLAHAPGCTVQDTTVLFATQFGNTPVRYAMVSLPLTPISCQPDLSTAPSSPLRLSWYRSLSVGGSTFVDRWMRLHLYS